MDSAFSSIGVTVIAAIICVRLGVTQAEYSYDLKFEDFYAENPDEVSTYEKWKPAIDLAVMVYKHFKEDEEDDEGPDSGRHARARSDLNNSTNATLSSMTSSSNSSSSSHHDEGDYLFDYDADSHNLNPADRINNRCPPLASRDKTTGRRQGRQLLPGLFFDETSEHPFIILLQYVVPLVSVDLPVLLPTNLRNLDRSKPTLAGGFEAIP